MLLLRRKTVSDGLRMDEMRNWQLILCSSHGHRRCKADKQEVEQQEKSGQAEKQEVIHRLPDEGPEAEQEVRAAWEIEVYDNIPMLPQPDLRGRDAKSSHSEPEPSLFIQPLGSCHGMTGNGRLGRANAFGKQRGEGDSPALDGPPRVVLAFSVPVLDGVWTEWGSTWSRTPRYEVQLGALHVNKYLTKKWGSFQVEYGMECAAKLADG